jgi:hypothetical protein
VKVLLNVYGNPLSYSAMPRVSAAVLSLPAAAASALRRLGADLATARKRRRQPLSEWAERIQVSIPTLMKMERGDPSVAAGVYATAIWILGRQEALAQVANPTEDLAALEVEIAKAQQRHAPK